MKEKIVKKVEIKQSETKKGKNLKKNAFQERLAKEELAAYKANRIAATDPEYKGKTKLQVKMSGVLLALLGAIMGAYATVSIMIPSGLTYGGITGLARMVQNYTGWNYSLTYYAFTFVITILVWIMLGLKEVKKILLLSVAYPGFMLLFELLDTKLLESNDTFLAAVFCGVAFGVSNGLTFKAGFSSGGTDSLAKIIKFKRLPHIGINDITFVINTAIVVVSAVVFGINVMLYTIITMYISMKVSEMVMFGLTDKLIELNIITEIPDDLKDYIINEIGRGLTSSRIIGEYTGEMKKQLKVICSPREGFLIKRFLAERDPQSFVSVFRVNSVWGVGRGFSDIREIDN